MGATETKNGDMMPVEIRQRLVETLELDLIGPWPEHELATEMIPGWVRPSNWYLTGFLIPIDTAAEEAADPESDDDFEEANEGDGEETTDDRVAAKKSYFPSSAGISTLVPAGAKEVSVTVTWGDYELSEFAPEPTDDEPEPKP